MYIIKLILINPFIVSYKKLFHLFTLYHFFSFRVRMSWNIGDNRNCFLKLKSKLDFCHVVLTTTKTSPEKLTFTVVEMQQLPDIEKTNSNKERSRLKWTIYNGRSQVQSLIQTSRLIQTI